MNIVCWISFSHVFYEGVLTNTLNELRLWLVARSFCNMPHICRKGYEIQSICGMPDAVKREAESVLWTVVLSWNEFQDRRIIGCNM